MGTLDYESKLIEFNQLKSLGEKLRQAGNKIITTNGCFDLIHLGHIQYLFAARNLGDVLICGVNSDDSVRRLAKGPGRPLNPAKVRAWQLSALSCVDYVCIFDHDTPIELISEIQPHVHVKGGDYQGKRLPEQDCLDKLGGELKLLPLAEGFSTTSIIERIKGISV